MTGSIRRGAGWAAGGMLLVGATLAGGAAAGIAYSQRVIDHALPLPPALPAQRRTFTSSVAGEVSYYVDDSGTGRPLVLIHSVNAAANAREMAPLFRHYGGQRPVFALDLPGYGFSERSDRVYTPALFGAAITDFLSEVVGQAADLVALSLGAEFAAAAALAEPERVSSLALISPSGLRGGEISLPGDGFYRFLAQPLWSQALFDLLASRRSIQLFLSRNFVGDLPAELADYAYTSAHQPGARYAPLTFVSGKLFTPDIWRTVYLRLAVPTLVIFDRDPNVTFDRLPAIMAANRYWSTARVAPSLGLPHWELPLETCAALDRFWMQPAAVPSAGG